MALERENHNVIDLVDFQIRKFVEEIRPSEEIRDKLDFQYSFDGREFLLNEVRPRWNQPEVKLARPIARAVFVKSRKIWKVYWMRASGKWQLYEPPEFHSINHVLEAIDRDEYGCFKG